MDDPSVLGERAHITRMRVDRGRAADIENQAIGPVTVAQRYERVHSQNVNGGDATGSEGELGDGRPIGDLKIPDIMDKPID